ncbi:methyltransferase domain-containing protein [Mycena metata]|uniref:Methyltransferase domain-containing protein n=1 Tax=Mycena metata TaxID=1033252 RepID=A0AAD7MHE5_9AGAR|nr:methyltransferase domain-containing protein [Mycena metata]
MSRLACWCIPAVLIFLAALCLLAQQHTNPSELSFNPKSWKNLHKTAMPASRLNQTLEMNEMRYQRAVQERRASIATIGAKKPAFPEPFSAYYTLWDLFAPVFSCPFAVWRVGTMGDGGKWVCGLERATSQPNCVIYSMGVERQSSFEQEALRQSERCQVDSTSPSLNGARNYAPTPRSTRALTSTHGRWAESTTTTRARRSTPCRGIMKELGHDFIDYLEGIDIEGSEFEALEAVIKSFKGQPLPFGQMEIEIHINYRDYMNTVGAVDKWWTMLEDAGLRPFWTELNLLDVNLPSPWAPCR